MSYSGDYTLIDVDDVDVRVTGTLTKSSSGGRLSWGGTGTIDPAAMSRVPRDTRVRLRLPDGAEADALVADVAFRFVGGSQSATVSLLGEGAAPF